MSVRLAEPSPVAAPQNVKGALWVLASGFCFVISMSLVKFLGRDLSAPLQAFFRQAVSLAVLLPWILRDPVGTFRTRQPVLFLSRGITTSLSIILAYYSYEELPLAEANALSFSRTLWMVPLAMVMLGERVPLPRLLATVAGFGGVLLVINPLSSDTALPLLPTAAGLGAAMLLAFSLAGVKALSRSHGQLSLLAWSCAIGTVFTLPTAIPAWHMPGLHDALLLAAMSIAGVGSQYFYARGLTIGEATAIAPVDYARIGMSVLFGVVFFGELPRAATWAGVALIVATTLYISWHASRRTVVAPAAATKDCRPAHRGRSRRSGRAAAPCGR